MLNAVLGVVKTDLRLFFRDKRAMVIAFATPIALASFMGFIFGGPDKDVKPQAVKVVLVDEDKSELTGRIAEALKADPGLALGESDSVDAASAKVRGGDAVVAIVLPKGFGEAATKALLTNQGRPKVRLLYDPSRSAELGMVRGLIIKGVMATLSQPVRDAVQASITKAGGDALPPTFDLSIPFDTEDEAMTARTGERYNGFAHSFAGMGVQFVLISALNFGVVFLTDRQRGIWKRLRAAPLSRAALLGSKMLSAALIASLSLVVLFTFGRIAFNVRVQGSLLGMILVCGAFATFSGAIGLFAAAVGKTPEATRGLGIFVLLVAVMLGGAWVPSFIFPPVLQKVTLVMPTRWAVDGLDLMTWRGQGLVAGATHAAVLLGFAAVFGVLAWMRFRWEE